jgi:hypothetical protein
MKKLLVLAFVAMICATGFSKTIDEVFNAFPKADNVEDMTIDKAMLGMAMSMGADQSGKMKDIEAMRVISIEDPTAEQINIAKEIIKDGVEGFEVMVDADDDGENVLILTQGDGTVISKMLIIAVEEDQVAVVMLEGKLDPNEATKMVNITK